jgi:hypothetical protein
MANCNSFTQRLPCSPASNATAATLVVHFGQDFLSFLLPAPDVPSQCPTIELNGLCSTALQAMMPGPSAVSVNSISAPDLVQVALVLKSCEERKKMDKLHHCVAALALCLTWRIFAS